ncbi:CAP domain-containing protein [Paraphoma chrysanthemicola]|uniref:CAP domain-containing protein n=1 Tax=Paraphoma chrysanthemicola TaxID=798071 RepID=A0A8K0W429_9PLEO|nr:CAP domain-containing protein [Paraphoma chrysanthemicola]
MHFSIFITSALTVGALARPRPADDAAAAQVTPRADKGLSRPPAPAAVAPTPRPFVQSSPSRAPLGPPRPSPIQPSPNRVPPLAVQPSSSRAIASVASPLQQASLAPAVAPPPAITPPPIGRVQDTHISGPSQASLSAGPEYQRAILYHHNAARANHNASPLVWDNALVNNALYTARTCIFEHSIPPGVRNGQNLFITSGSNFNVTAGITEFWYKSEFPYMQPYFGNTPQLPDAVFHQVGHLTQMLWKTTTSVGCVSVDCTGRMVVPGGSPRLDKYTVCNYSPPGNVRGGYAAGVGPPIQSTSLGSWLD